MPTQARTSKKYENHEVYSPAGELMFRTSLKRCQWYVVRGLATEIISTTDSTMTKEKGEEVSGVRSFQLLFEPKGKGHARGREGDAWFLEEKKDRCVICGFISTLDPEKGSNVESGESETLKENHGMSGGERKDGQNENEDTKRRDSGLQKTGKTENPNGIIFHHVVPFCYRKYMPEAIKSSNSHDIQPLCIKCHNAYQAPATSRMTEICEKFGAPLLGIGMVTSEENAIKKKVACDVFNVRKMKAPKDRILQVEGRMREVYGLSEEDDITEEIIKAAMDLPISWRSEEFKTHGQLVVEALGEERLPEFVVEWRKHFMETMKPRFLSEHWGVDNPVMHD